MKANLTIMPIKKLLEERIRQQLARRVPIQNALNGIVIFTGVKYTKDDLIAIDQDIAICRAALKGINDFITAAPAAQQQPV